MSRWKDHPDPEVRALADAVDSLHAQLVTRTEERDEWKRAADDTIKTAEQAVEQASAALAQRNEARAALTTLCAAVKTFEREETRTTTAWNRLLEAHAAAERVS